MYLLTNLKKRQEWQKAKTAIFKCIKHNPFTSFYYTEYATMCILINNLEEARKTLEIALSKFGRTYEILRLISDYWVALKQFSNAEACFKEMLLMGEEVDILIRLVYVQIMQQKYDEAVKIGQMIIDKYLFCDTMGTDFSKKVISKCIHILKQQDRNLEAEIMTERLIIRFPVIEV